MVLQLGLRSDGVCVMSKTQLLIASGVTMRQQADPARWVQHLQVAMQLLVMSSVLSIRLRARAARNSVKRRRAVPSQAFGMRLPAQRMFKSCDPSTAGHRPKQPTSTA